MALQVEAVAVRGTWLKHAYAGSPPLPEREPPPDNRWQRGSVVDALYLADNEETVWAEWYRHLAERMVPPLAQMPRELWRWQVDVEVADLSTPERLSAAGLDERARRDRSLPDRLTGPQIDRIPGPLPFGQVVLAPGDGTDRGWREFLGGVDHRVV